MLQVNISVGLANILFWMFTELFVLLLPFQTTRLVAREWLTHALKRGQKISLRRSFLDRLPYNGDIQPVQPRLKLGITLVRLSVVLASAYLGYALDGAIVEDNSRFPVVGTLDTVWEPGDKSSLTDNSGREAAAMAKLSCLRILADDRVTLYKGYFGGEKILCEDGDATFETKALLHANTDQNLKFPTRGESMSGMRILESTESKPDYKLEKEKERIVFSRKETAGEISIVLIEKRNSISGTPGMWCSFGFTRTKGNGFEIDVTMLLSASCDVQIREFHRTLRPKPLNMPPCMSFFHQVADAIVIHRRATSIPRRKGKSVRAAFDVAGLSIGIAVAVLAGGMWTCLQVVRWRRGGEEPVDVLSPEGVARLWGGDKFGRTRSSANDSDLFIAFDGTSKLAYLGSSDSEGGVVRDDLESGSGSDENTWGSWPLERGVH